MAGDRRELRTDFVSRDVSTAKTIKGIANEAERAADHVDELGDQAAQTGEQLEDLGDDAAKTASLLAGLDVAAGKARTSIRDLAREAAESGDLTLFRDINKQKAELRKLGQLRQILEEAGEEGAKGFSAAFIARLGPLMARAPVSLGPAGTAIGAPLAAGAAVVVGTAVAGAIIGGSAGVGIVGGLAVAAGHPQVKAEASKLGEQVGETLERGFVSFVPASVNAIGIFQRKLRESEGDINRLGAATSRFVEPLTEAGGSAIQDLLSGVATLAQRADPVVDALGDGLARLGETAREGLEDLADNANEGARALAITFAVVDYGVTAFFRLTDAAAETFGWMDKIAAIQRGDPEPFIRDLYEDAYQAQDATGGLSDELVELLGMFDDTGAAAATATQEIRDLYTVMREGTSINLDARQAQRDFEQAIDDATETIERNGEGLDRNTQKGRENESALDAIRRKAFEAAEAVRAMGGSQQEANAILERGRQAFVNAAVAAGMDRAAAIALAESLFAIPSPKPKVTLNTKQAQAEAQVIQDAINGIHGKNVMVGVYFVTHGRNKGDLKVPGGFLTKSEGGPVIGPGTGTSDDVLLAASNGEYVIRAGAAAVLGTEFLDSLNQVDRTGRSFAGPARSGATAPAGVGLSAREVGRAVGEELRVIFGRGLRITGFDAYGNAVVSLGDRYARSGGS